MSWLQAAAHVAVVLQALVLTVGLIFTVVQLRLIRDEKRRANAVAIAQSVGSHNALMLADGRRCRAIEEILGLMFGDVDREEYWAARAVHLGHLDLLWQVWELANRPKRGVSLPDPYIGWQRFAERVFIPSLHGVSGTDHSKRLSPAIRLAGAHLLTGIEKYEVIDPTYCEWLMEIAKGLGLHRDAT